MCFIYTYPSYRCHFPHQPAAFIDFWTPSRTLPLGSAAAVAGKQCLGGLYGSQNINNGRISYNEMLAVIQTYFRASVIWLNIGCFCLLMSHSQGAEIIPQTQLWKLALKAMGLEFPVIIDEIFTRLHSLWVGYQPWCILLFISFHWTLK